MNVADMKLIYHDTDEKYVELAVERYNREGCPPDEEPMSWFGKLLIAEIFHDSSMKAIKEEVNRS